MNVKATRGTDFGRAYLGATKTQAEAIGIRNQAGVMLPKTPARKALRVAAVVIAFLLAIFAVGITFFLAAA